MFITRIIGICFAAVGGLIMAAAGVSPEEAISNLAAWAKAFGVESLPAWLVSTDIDFYVQVIGGIILIASLFLIFTTTKWWGVRKTSEGPIDNNLELGWVPLVQAVIRVKEKCNYTRNRDAARDLTQAGYSGDLRFRGNAGIYNKGMKFDPPFKEIKTEVPKRYWQDMCVSLIGIFADNYQIPDTGHVVGTDYDLVDTSRHYYQLEVSKPDLDKLWPLAST